MTITAKELALTNTLRMTTEALTLVTAERDALKAILVKEAEIALTRYGDLLEAKNEIESLTERRTALNDEAEALYARIDELKVENVTQRKILEQAKEALRGSAGFDERNNAIEAIQGVLKS